MDKLTQQILILNQLYSTFKLNFDVLKKMFNNNSTIKQKIILSEAMLNQVYISIMEKLESGEINKQFKDIIKGIRDEKQKRNR